MTLRIFLFLCLMTPVSKGIAQRTGAPPRRSTVAIGLQYGKPVGSFAEACDHVFIGYGAQAAFALPDLPFDVGLGISSELMSRRTFRIPVNMEYIPDATGTLVVRGNVYTALPFVRFRPLQGAVSPYVDAFAGGILFNTRSHLDVASLDDPVMRQSLHSDIGTMWGWAGGIHVRLSDDTMIEARYERGYGGRATFVDALSTNGSNAPTFIERTSTTESWRCRIALVVCF